MFRNYLKSGLRNLWKNKGFSTINILGLAIGLAVCLLIVLYVVDELSYDRYNKKADRIYRIDADIFFNNTSFIASVGPEPLASTLLKEYPQIANMTRIYYQGDIHVKKDHQNLLDHGMANADSTFFQVFSIPLIAGDPRTALKEPKSIVIDETTALKYFGSTDVLGKTLEIDNTHLCRVTGVMKDIPSQSHFHFRFIRPLIDTYRGNAEYWFSNNAHSYVVVKPGVTQQQLQGYVDDLIEKHLGRQLQAELKTTIAEQKKAGNYFRYHAMPLTKIHLDSDKSYEFEANGNRSYVYIFSVIAIFILLVACINFMNLSTARSANRAKEVGIRKVVGSLRTQLIVQFLTESLLLSFFALILALCFSALLLPLFNQLAGKDMSVSSFFTSWLFPLLISLVTLVGLIAGSYPAFFLSSFRPILVLKGKLNAGFRKSWLRSSLVVFQFCISIVLIIGTMVIYDQLEYIRNRKIGYNRQQVLVLHNTWALDKQRKTFREEILKIPGISNATISTDLPTGTAFDQSAWFRENNPDPTRAVITTNFYVDENYIPTLGMEMIKGRGFSEKIASDSSALVLNEAAVKLLGYKDPINEVLYLPSGENMQLKRCHVIGVVRDFNFSSMHTIVQPLIMRLADFSYGRISIRLNTNNVNGVIKQVEAKWKSMVPIHPFTYTFMDSDFEKIYESEQRTGKLFVSFAILAIFIACLGLLGLAAYAAEQRTKEIGIRKVLGARIGGIVAMLSKDFARLVLIASVIAFPLAWWMMSKWLEDFAYRINISGWVFVLATIIAMMIALLSVSYQAIKAAVMNPVKSLRSE